MSQYRLGSAFWDASVDCGFSLRCGHVRNSASADKHVVELVESDTGQLFQVYATDVPASVSQNSATNVIFKAAARSKRVTKVWEAVRAPISSLKFSQSSMSDRFQDLRPLHALVSKLKASSLEDGPDNLLDGHWIVVVHHRGELYSMDNRRLWCLKEACSPETRVLVRYCSNPKEYGLERFNAKFSTANHGETIQIISSDSWALSRETISFRVDRTRPTSEGPVETRSAASVASFSFTNSSIEYISEYCGEQDLAWSETLLQRTFERGLKLLKRQTSVTEHLRSQRNMRLYGWLYVHRHTPEDVIQAIRAEEHKLLTGKGKGKGKHLKRQIFSRFGPLQQQQLREKLESAPVYHYAIRGSDPRLVDLKTTRGCVDVVTSYFKNPIFDLRSLIQEKLDEVFDMPDELGQSPCEYFKELITSDVAFTDLLQQLYLSHGSVSKTNSHARKGLAGRLNGKNCVFHKTLKLNDAEFCKYLLDHHTPEKTIGQPWMCFAEPCWPVGPFRQSAFHQAVWDSHHECLQVLVDYAQDAKLDIRSLRNVEDPETVTGQTVLELAESKGDVVSFNILCPLFGVPPKQYGAEAGLTAVAKRREDKYFNQPNVITIGIERGRNFYEALVVRSLEIPRQCASSAHRSDSSTQASTSPSNLAESNRAADRQAHHWKWSEFAAQLEAILSKLTDAEHKALHRDVRTEEDTNTNNLVLKVLNAHFCEDCSQFDIAQVLRAATRNGACRITKLLFGACLVPNPTSTMLAWLEFLHYAHSRGSADPDISSQLHGVRSVSFPFSRLMNTSSAEDPNSPCGVMAEGAELFWTETLIRDILFRLLWQRGTFIQLRYGEQFASLKNGWFAPSDTNLYLAVLEHAQRVESLVGYLYRSAVYGTSNSAANDDTVALALLAPAEMITIRYWQDRHFSSNRVEEVRDGMRPEAVYFVELLVRFWFRSWDTNWDVFLLRLLKSHQQAALCHFSTTERDEESCMAHPDERILLGEVKRKVCENVDVALETILRMHDVLGYTLKRHCAGKVLTTNYDSLETHSFAGFFKDLLPTGATEEPPLTLRMLERIPRH